jgi:DNA-binding transcriptional LysR family regulator
MNNNNHSLWELSMSRLDDYELFWKVASAGGFSEAARSIHVSQSTISKRMARLEGTLGVPLFQRRSPYPAQLTRHGSQLRDLLDDVMNRVHDIPSRIRHESRQAAAVSIGVDALAPPEAALRITETLLQTHHRVEIRPLADGLWHTPPRADRSEPQAEVELWSGLRPGDQDPENAVVVPVTLRLITAAAHQPDTAVESHRLARSGIALPPLPVGLRNRLLQSEPLLRHEQARIIQVADTFRVYGWVISHSGAGIVPVLALAPLFPVTLHPLHSTVEWSMTVRMQTTLPARARSDIRRLFSPVSTSPESTGGDV